MAFLDSMDEIDWNKFYTDHYEALVKEAKRKLWFLRRADGNEEDVIQSTFRTLLARQRETDRPAKQLDPTVENIDGLFVLLIKNLQRKIDKYRHQQSAEKRSAVRTGDVSQAAAEIFNEVFVKKGDVNELDAEKYLDAAIAPIEDLSDNLKEIAKLRLQRFTLAEIGEKTGQTPSRVHLELAKIAKHLRLHDED